MATKFYRSPTGAPIARRIHDGSPRDALFRDLSYVFRQQRYRIRQRSFDRELDTRDEQKAIHHLCETAALWSH